MSVNKDEPIYPISVVSKLIGIRPESLRAYEDEGLIITARTKGKKGGKRLYSQNDIEWIKFIRKLIQDENLSMTCIKRLMQIFQAYEINKKPSEKEKWVGFGVSNKDEWALMKKYCEKV